MFWPTLELKNESDLQPGIVLCYLFGEPYVITNLVYPFFQNIKFIIYLAGHEP